MKLISLHLDVTYPILVGAFYNASIASGKFWTSATDQGCKKNFGFCSANRLLRGNARWGMGQPDLLIEEGTCLAVTAPDGLLHDEICSTKMRYVCEARVQAPSFFNEIEIECAREYNLTASEVRALYNTTADELREKCFIKCYGEGTGLFIDGVLAEDKIFAFFQDFTTDNFHKLLDMYTTLDYCTNVTKGMDVCDKCSELLTCGQENSPDYFGELVETMEISIAVCKL
ncbi:uncharacterized protein LOC135937573 [Cloeon dipterum]|uniref:uncharacterized protein LOC135937573 n=1 Tax=Cloeon dipterum TaxID=197152 RepID=UPI0032200309